MVVQSFKIEQSFLIVKVKVQQYDDHVLLQLREGIQQHKMIAFELKEDGVLRYHGLLCVLDMERFREIIMAEVDHSWYSIHQGSTKNIS